ncbi:MAG: hypothetical protein E7596_00070 [Ruminococcaceae bacterium]|nr:hypothetical protein [Oscillospiraceae bacterium]
MKKLTTIVLSVLLVLSLFAFTSCDQASVDSTLENLVNTGKDLLGPFFKIAESSSEEDDGSGDDVDPEPESSLMPDGEGTTDTEPEGDNADGEGTQDDTTTQGGAADTDEE